MAKFGGSAMTMIGNAAKRVSKSKVVKKTAIAGKKAIRGAKKGIAGVKGSGGLKGAVSKIKPIRADLKQGGIRKINKLVENRVSNLIPKLSNKIEEKVDSFDPKNFLGKIFDGGLDSLNGFAGGLDGLKDNMKENAEFMEKAHKLATDFINKLSKGKKKKKGGGVGGLIGNVFKGLAVAGVAMLAAPAVAKVAVAGGAGYVGGKLLKKGIDFIRGRKKKKLEKKQEKTRKDKKGGKTDSIFSSILSKLDGVLGFDKPKTEETAAVPMDKPIPEKFIGGILGFGGKKKKEPENYQDLVKMGVTFEDTGVQGSARYVEAVHPRDPHAADNKAMGNTRNRKYKQRIQKAYYSGFGSPKHEQILNLPLEDFINLQLYGIDPSTKEKVKAEKKGKVEVKNKRMRGMGAKDRGREGGNFSGDKQKNVRGENMKGFMPDIGKLLGKSKDLLGGLAGGIGGIGSKIGSGIGDFLKSDAANILSRGMTGTVGSGINMVKSLFKPSKEALEKRTSVAGAVSKPVGKSSGGGNKSGGGAAGALLQSGGGKAAQPQKMERDIVTPTNTPIGLIAVDLNNLHILHSKSVFNIVDAL